MATRANIIHFPPTKSAIDNPSGASIRRIVVTAKALAEAMQAAFGGTFDVQLDTDPYMINVLVHQRESEA